MIRRLYPQQIFASHNELAFPLICVKCANWLSRPNRPQDKSKRIWHKPSGAALILDGLPRRHGHRYQVTDKSSLAERVVDNGRWWEPRANTSRGKVEHSPDGGVRTGSALSHRSHWDDDLLPLTSWRLVVLIWSNRLLFTFETSAEEDRVDYFPVFLFAICLRR